MIFAFWVPSTTLLHPSTFEYNPPLAQTKKNCTQYTMSTQKACLSRFNGYYQTFTVRCQWLNGFIQDGVRYNPDVINKVISVDIWCARFFFTFENCWKIPHNGMFVMWV